MHPQATGYFYDFPFLILLKAICEEVLKEQDTATNEIYRRKRDSYTPYMYGDYEEYSDR